MNFAFNELTVIIVLFEEKKDLLFKCLENIKNFKIIIIDNAGNSNLKLEVEKNFSIQKYILNKKNYGFTKAANQAIKLCNTDYILNINADCFIKEKDILLLIKSHQNYNGCFITSPTFYDNNLKLTYNAGCFDEKNLDIETLDLDGDVCVDKVLGSAILFKNKDIIEIGFLDENFFMYYEDDDLCRKIKKKNMSVIQIYNAKAQHMHGQSKVKNPLKRTFIRNYHFTFDELYYYFKINMHQKKYKNLKKKLPNYIVKLIINFIILRFNKGVYYFSIIKAFYDFNKLINK
jgi:N-acetylglucosaminyl-diphospho-decaprenol L-rhamnosyltransferase|tara:strand:+ start:62 stop:928 length:867 start_codon:yes stop_codon:yes gene_type:complete